MTYNPSHLPPILDVAEMQKYVEDELRKIAIEFAETTVVELRPIFRAPTKKREGMVVYADGTLWNPGSGKGVYVWTGSAWSKL